MKSVRLRLLLLALLPLIVLLPILLFASIAHWTDKFDNLLISKVSSDLRIADQYMQRIMTTQGNQISAVAASASFRDAVAGGDKSITEYLAHSRETLGLDYLIVRKKNRDQTQIIAPEANVEKRALSEGTSTTIEVFSPEELTAISPALAQRASVPLVSTKAATPSLRSIEGRGMVILGATSIQISGQSAVLIGGTLLNHNLDFIDTINDLIYSNQATDTGQAGTATLFLEDVRISTNVRLFENVRALGTRVSEAVYQTVLDNGETWLDRAFVVNDWYISGYLPIQDSQKNRIGMLYVGFLEEPFVAIRTKTYLSFLTAFLIVIALSIPFFLWIARGVFSPLEKMNRTMRHVEKGDLNARIRHIHSKDEIAEVASHLNDLLDQIQDRDKELHDWANTLNVRVDKRTAELRETNTKLEETHKQLVMSEKLATIGEITAGVAHEINNPVAVIQGSADVMRMELGEYAKQYTTELDLIDAQVHRINSIVGKLLLFAKPNDFSGLSESLNVTDVLEDSLVLVHPSLMKLDIVVTRDFKSTTLVSMIRGELQQILVNLLVNAIQAMPDGGTLLLSIRDIQRNAQTGVEVCISDSGKGIEQSIIDQIFDPFFTTKKSEGTGLGLSISQSLIQQIGGVISVKSQIGEGSQFFVWIPETNKMSDKPNCSG